MLLVRNARGVAMVHFTWREVTWMAVQNAGVLASLPLASPVATTEDKYGCINFSFRSFLSPRSLKFLENR